MDAKNPFQPPPDAAPKQPRASENHWRNGLHSPSVRGGIVTAVATVLAAAVIVALHRLRAARQA